MGEPEPIEVFPLAQFVGEEMEERGWTSADVTIHMGYADNDDFGKKCFMVELFLAVQDDKMKLDEQFLGAMERAFGVSSGFFGRLHEEWLKYPDRRAPYEAPEILFSGTFTVRP